MRRGDTKGQALRAGVLALVIVAVAVFFGFTKYNPFANRFEFAGAFRTANDIKRGAAVRIAGVNVGKVTAVEPGPSGSSIVRMKVRDSGLPLHADATLKIRPRIFLEGNWFVDVQPGSPSAPLLEEGATIGVQQTGAPVQFGQLLTALQSDTRQDLQVVLDEYGRALEPKGAKGYARSIPYWEGAFRDSAIVNEATLGSERHDLSNWLRGADRFARGLDRSPAALKALITNLADTADAFASEESNLSAAIHELPRTLQAGYTALNALNDAFPPLRRLTADLRPTVRESGPALDAQLPLLQQLRGFVSRPELRGLARDLRHVVPDLAELNTAGVSLQQQLRLLSSCTNEVLTPWRTSTVPDTQFPASGPVFEEQVKWLPGIAAESRGFDANGQYVRSLVNGFNYAYAVEGGRQFFTGLPLEGINPPRADHRPPLHRKVPCETQEPPDLRSQPDQPPPAVKVNRSTAAFQKRWDAGVDDALKFVRDDVKGLGLHIPVVEQP
ncbi:MAG: phospholipid/cholesterol/gamma-HCH transport system substrate-binding protein [Solirubrobacteraceae bacterium]|nr:phospholipid/cholesterol/gamma-HCH transport system substrate-binding protein [Solirubrobacteraceae bacterium]